MQRELLEVERLARALLETELHFVGECDSVCDESINCQETVEGEVECPKCGTKVPFSKECDGSERCGSCCEADVEVEVDDEDVVRDLRLALVALDLAREREKERAAAVEQEQETVHSYLRRAAQ